MTEWHYIDLNPSRVRFTQQLSLAYGLGAQLYEDSFDDYARRTGLPDYDYIARFGSWV